MKMTELIINSWKDWAGFIEETLKVYSDNYGDNIQFRGQSDYEWNLTTSLSRVVKGDKMSESKANFYERESQMEFLSQAHLLDSQMKFDREINPESLLVDMQHYSCPTRLLDWSQSPFVALYFAINENLNKDGAFYAWDIRFFKNHIKELYPNIKEPKSTEITSFQEYDTVEMIYSIKKNERIVRQQGSFSVSNNLLKDHDEIICDPAQRLSKPSGLFKIKVPCKLKIEFLARLKTMNISSESLFPGLDGLGKSIKEMLLIRKWNGK